MSNAHPSCSNAQFSTAAAIAVATTAVATSAMMSGCRGIGSTAFVTMPTQERETVREGAVRIDAHGVRLEYAPDIDRVVFIGPIDEAGDNDGPNLVFVNAMEEEPDGDGGYTFFGGLYSWVSPQNGERGWMGAEGERSPWPPDPAMDRGPTRIVQRSSDSLTAVSPVDRQGLQQTKSLRVTDGGEVEVAVTVRNVSEASKLRGVWLNTAVETGGVIAVKLADAPGVDASEASAGWERGVAAWNDDPASRLLDIASGPVAGSWTLIDTADATWQGGTKFFIDGATEIAVWSPAKDDEGGGYWLHRRLVNPMSVGDRTVLIEHGEAPVAIYIDPAGLPSGALIEAELYSPMVELQPGDEVTQREVWRVIPAATADPAALEAMPAGAQM